MSIATREERKTTKDGVTTLYLIDPGLRRVSVITSIVPIDDPDGIQEFYVTDEFYHCSICKPEYYSKGILRIRRAPANYIYNNFKDAIHALYEHITKEVENKLKDMNTPEKLLMFPWTDIMDYQHKDTTIIAYIIACEKHFNIKIPYTTFKSIVPLLSDDELVVKIIAARTCAYYHYSDNIEV